MRPKRGQVRHGSTAPVESVGTSDDLALWRRLSEIEIGFEDAQLSFADRLARENGWSRPFADRVVAEYRRFLFLGQVAGHPVTPSDQVDQAWHLHLTYTRSYWDELCGEVLGRPFHHGPTRGGPAEGARYRQWYQETKASYEHWFGHEPPADIWPPSEVRFGLAPHFVRVNTRSQWVVTKPRGTGRPSALALGSALVLAGCSGLGAVSVLAQASSVDTEQIPWWAPALVVGLLGMKILSSVRRRFRRMRRRVGGRSAYDPGLHHHDHGYHDDNDGGGGWSLFGGGDGGDSGGGSGCSGCGGCGSD